MYGDILHINCWITPSALDVLSADTCLTSEGSEANCARMAYASNVQQGAAPPSGGKGNSGGGGGPSKQRVEPISHAARPAQPTSAVGAKESLSGLLNAQAGLHATSDSMANERLLFGANVLIGYKVEVQVSGAHACASSR